jgi:rod shape-determining protein MreC
MRKAGVVILVLLAISVLLIIVDQVVGLGLLKGGLTWLLTPLQRGVSSEGPAAATWWERWQEAGRLQQENKELREVIDELKAREVRYQEIERQYRELLQLLGLHERFPELVLLDAEVIGRDPSNLRQVLRISWVASGDTPADVRVGMPVIAAAGLVGRVIAVYPNAADVLLIIDRDSSVSAVIQNDDRPTGVVEGRWQAGSRLLMRYIPQGDAVNEGDWVVTSGLRMRSFEEDAFPAGIPIGQVLRLEVAADMHQQAELLPAVDLDHLERVMIVLGTR